MCLFSVKSLIVPSKSIMLRLDRSKSSKTSTNSLFVIDPLYLISINCLISIKSYILTESAALIPLATREKALKIEVKMVAASFVFLNIFLPESDNPGTAMMWKIFLLPFDSMRLWSQLQTRKHIQQQIVRLC